MARFEHSVAIAAPPVAVWEVWTDIAKWPDWSPPMQHVEPATDGPLALGSQALVQADGGPASTWEVTELRPGEYFEWRTKVRGVTVVAGHRVAADGSGTRATATVEYRGFMAAIFRPMLLRVARRNVTAECEGLKQRCETGSPGPLEHHSPSLTGQPGPGA